MSINKIKGKMSFLIKQALKTNDTDDGELFKLDKEQTIKSLNVEFSHDWTTEDIKWVDDEGTAYVLMIPNLKDIEITITTPEANTDV